MRAASDARKKVIKNGLRHKFLSAKNKETVSLDVEEKDHGYLFTKKKKKALHWVSQRTKRMRNRLRLQERTRIRRKQDLRHQGRAN